MLGGSRIDLPLLALLILNRLLLHWLLLRMLIILLLLYRLLLRLLIILLLRRLGLMLLRRLLLYRLLLYRLLLLHLLIVLLLCWLGLTDLEIEATDFIGFRHALQPFQEFDKIGGELPALGVTIAVVETVDSQRLPGINNHLLVSLHVIGGSDQIFEGLTDLDMILTHDAYLDLGAVFVDLLRFVVLLLNEGKIT